MKNKNRPYNKSGEKIPLFSIFLLALSVFAVIILAISSASKNFASFFDKSISGPIRHMLAAMTNFIPFSLAELLIILLPVLVTILIIYAIKKRAHSTKSIISYFVSLLACGAMMFTIFVFSFGVGYHVPTLYERFDISENGSSTEELKATAIKLTEEINKRAPSVEFDNEGFSVMPYSLSVMNEKLVYAYKIISKEYDFVQGFSSNIKPVLMSVPMSYAHTTGVYTFFTGEANLNVDFPDYTLPYTTAHELAHQRGIARENEANFMAFVAGLQTNDEYIEYSVYLNIFEYVASSLYMADLKAYQEIYILLDDSVKKELAAYSRFYEKYRDSKAGEISSSINDAYLIANGTAEGTNSYGLVTDLAVAYFNGEFDD